MSLEASPHEVLDHYPAFLRGKLVFLGNHGGFSGARLWRIHTAEAGTFCLKAWPADGRSPSELAWIHALLQRACAFAWMPRIMPTSQGETFISSRGRLCEIATWMPGSADFSQTPSTARLEAVCIALAQLHQLWATGGTRRSACPAIGRRWESWQRWVALLETGWRPRWDAIYSWTGLTEQLWRLILARRDEVSRLLSPWRDRSVSIQPCLCDVWHDHVLFSGESVTGLIDFGSIKDDHIAVDLARLLGSLIGDNPAMWELGMSAYQRVRPLSLEDRLLARDLDRSGIILAATHWLRWLYHERRTCEHPAAVSARLVHLVERLHR